MLKIRLQRKGRKKRPFYRIVVAEHTAPVRGKFIEIVGHYDPLATPKTFVFKKDRIEHFITNGAMPSETVARLLEKEGVEVCKKFIRNRKMKPSNAEIEAQKAKEDAIKAEEEAAKQAAESAEEATEEKA